MMDPQERYELLTTALKRHIQQSELVVREARGLADAVSVYLSRDDAEPCACDFGFLCHDCQLRRALAAFEAAEKLLVVGAR